jgi:HSP20 family protein
LSYEILNYFYQKQKVMTLLVKRNGAKFPSLLTKLLDTENMFGKRFFDDDNFFNVSLSKIPSANVTEMEKEFIIELTAPGLEKKDSKVELENNLLSISSEKEIKRENKKGEITSREFSYESFSRSFRLPDNIVADKLQAQYENGILKIEIPKKEATVLKPKKEITVA